MKYTHAIIHKNGVDFALSQQHAQAIFLQLLTCDSGDLTVAVLTDSDVSYEEAVEKLKQLDANLRSNSLE
jgi:cephalosporin hydroxylase